MPCLLQSLHLTVTVEFLLLPPRWSQHLGPARMLLPVAPMWSWHQVILALSALLHPIEIFVLLY